VGEDRFFPVGGYWKMAVFSLNAIFRLDISSSDRFFSSISCRSSYSNRFAMPWYSICGHTTGTRFSTTTTILLLYKNNVWPKYAFIVCTQTGSSYLGLEKLFGADHADFVDVDFRQPGQLVEATVQRQRTVVRFAVDQQKLHTNKHDTIMTYYNMYWSIYNNVCTITTCEISIG